MRIRFGKICLLLVLSTLGMKVDAQFIHFTHQNMNPLMINPGNTGGFYGTFRGGAIVRDQDFRIASNNQEFQMINGSVDVNIDGIGFKKEDWISAGINFGRQGLTADFTRTELYPSLAYHFVLDKKTMSDIAIGFSAGTIINTLNRNSDFVTLHGLTTGDLTDGQDIFNNAQDGQITANSADYSLGVVLTTPLSKYSGVKLGVSLRQPFRPEVGLSTPVADRLDRDFTAFGIFKTQLSDRLSFKPGFVLNVEGRSASFLNLQANIGYRIIPDKDITLNGGVGIRTLTGMGGINSLLLLVGADIKDFRIGLAYDHHFGSMLLANAAGPGALELSLSKVFKIHKKPDPQPILLCPRL